MQTKDENLIKILGIEDMPDDQKIEIIGKASDLVQQRLLIRIIDSLKDERREEFISLLEKDSKDDLQKFIVANVPNLLLWIEEETAKVKQDFAQIIEKIQ